jgi:hypothetical protein
MKTRIIALLLVACMLFLTLASCGGEEGGANGGGGNGGNPNGEHVHTFSESWTSNATQHWHQATCAHGEIKDGLADHKDLNEDGLCDVCDYEIGHEHTFADEWSFDDNYHWKGASCSHKVEQDEVDLHSDDDNNGVCEVCGGHVHSVGPTGFCKYDGCNKPMQDIDTSDFTTIIKAVTNQGSLVNSVQINHVQKISSAYKDYSDGTNWLSYNRTQVQNIDVIFGKNGYVNSFTDTAITTGLGSHQNTTNSTFESWHEKDGDASFGVVSENGEAFIVDSSNPDRLFGNLYTLSTIASGYGTENFLYSLYEAAVSANALNLTVDCSVEGQVSFSFNLLFVETIIGRDMSAEPTIDPETGEEKYPATTTYNVNYYDVEVSFSYNDMYVVTNMDVSCKSYTNNAGQLSDKTANLKDVNLKYYPETGKFDFVKYDETYNPDGDDHYRVVDKSQLTPNLYTYSITQTVGDRTEKNEYPKSYFIPAGFDIFSDPEHTTLLGDSVDIAIREFLFVYLGNYRPEGSSLEYVYDLVTFKILDAYGKEIKGTDIMEGDSNVIKASFTMGAEEGRYFIVYPLKAGKYTFVINYQGETVHTVTVNVK